MADQTHDAGPSQTSSSEPRSPRWLVLVGLITACLAVGGLGALSTSRSVETWYAALAKPSWTPPDWLFGPVWTALYVTMAIAAWLVWCEGALPNTKTALALFAGQLLLNAVWSPLFFGLRNPLAGLIDIALLWVAIVATLTAFWRVKRVAVWIFLPYVLWVTFAVALNAAIWRLNE